MAAVKTSVSELVVRHICWKKRNILVIWFI